MDENDNMRLLSEINDNLRTVAQSIRPLPTFFNARTAHRLLQSAGIVGCWDFNTALGNSIRDKYDTLYVKIVEMSSVLLGRGAHGYFWVVTSPEVFALIDTAVSGRPTLADGEQMPMSLTEGQLKDMGVLSKRWRVFVTEQWPTNQLLIGADYEERPIDQYARLNICNFVI